jgi:hypothetical protein
MKAASKSRKECTASEIMAMDPVKKPAISFNIMRSVLETIEIKAYLDLLCTASSFTGGLEESPVCAET